MRPLSASTRCQTPARRGSVYVMVLGVGLLITVIGLAGVMSARIDAQTHQRWHNLETAKAAADAGLDLALWAMDKDPSWRTTRGASTWYTNHSLPSGATATVSVRDAIDGNITNNPHQQVVVRCEGRFRGSLHTFEAVVDASPVALDALAFAVHAAGGIAVSSGTGLSLPSGTLSSNGLITNSGSIYGNVSCTSLTNLGSISGTSRILAPASPMPASTLLADYTARGTRCGATSSTIEKIVMTPTYTPTGCRNADGVYIFESTGDLTLRNLRIHGTLVILAPGKRVTISDTVFMEPFRADYPVIITNAAELVIKIDRGDLNEAALSTNFNPAGAPYNGVSDATNSNKYPSVIRGLIHALGTVKVESTPYVEGLILAGSSSALEAVIIKDAPQVKYTPSLFTNPTIGYTKSIPMKVRAGSFVPVVTP